MTRKQPHNLPASIHHRLLQIAKTHGEEYQLILTRYAMERLLYRLSQSAHLDRLILKGATLFVIWNGVPHRPTRDLDFLGYGDPSVSAMVELFRDLCDQPVQPDGLAFIRDSVQGAQVREDEVYEGVRINLRSMMANAKIPIQIDIGFGDIITPTPQIGELPGLLDLPIPRLKVYPRETVVAEKCEAMVSLGLANSRLKDFYDLWYISSHFDFNGQLLADAILATFMRRGTTLPFALPIALKNE